MRKKLGVVMDPIDKINYKKDSTLAMCWEAKKRGWDIFYIEQKNLFFRNEDVFANTQALDVFHDPERWYELGSRVTLPLREFDVILMRKDPPFDLEYIYSTYLLEFAEKQGVLVLNKPQSLRDANEKLFTMWFPTCCPASIVTRDIQLLKDFLRNEQDIVTKPLDGMGGTKIFRLKYPDENASAVFETLTENGLRMVMAQRYIAEIKEGDKRILLIDGEPVPYVLARIPAPGELRGNLAAGGHGVVQPLSERDHIICQTVGPLLREKGLLFVGIDVIGDYLTEINVTSPTCIREIEDHTHIPISTQLFDCIDRKLKD